MSSCARLVVVFTMAAAAAASHASAEDEHPAEVRSTPTLHVGSVPVDLATSAAGCECQSSWYENTWHNPHSWRNVKAFGAVGNGVADDTAAFRAAINFNQTTVGEKQHFVVYVPPGEYVVTDTIVLWKGTHLHGMQGPSCCRPVIRLVNNTRLFAGPLLRPVLVSTNGWGIDPTSNDWCTDNSTLGGSSNNNFQTQIQHVQLHLGANPGAVGILWKVAQQTSIRMVDIVAADAAIGLDAGGGNDYADDPGCADSLKGRFPSQSGGGTIEGVSISGGRIGLRGSGSQWLFRSVFVDGSSEVGVQIPGCWGFVFPPDSPSAPLPCAAASRAASSARCRLSAEASTAQWGLLAWVDVQSMW